MTRRPLSVLAVLLLAVAACGDDDSGDTSSDAPVEEVDGAADGSGGDGEGDAAGEGEPGPADGPSDDPAAVAPAPVEPGSSDGGEDPPAPAGGGDSGSDGAGDSGSDGAGDGDDPPPTGADQDASEAAVAAFEADLRAQGFEKEQDAEEQGEDDDFQFESEECKRFQELFDDDLQGESANAEGDGYTRGDFDPTGGVQDTVSGFIGMTEQASQQDRVYELLRDPRLPGCVEEAFRKGAEEEATAQGAELKDIRSESLPGVGVGTEGAGVRVTGVFTVATFEIPFDFRLQFERVERATVGVFWLALGQEPSTYDHVGGLRILADQIRPHAG